MSFDDGRRVAAYAKSRREIAAMREPARALHGLFESLHDFVRPGSTPLRIQEFCARFLEHHRLAALLPGYRGFPGVACVSVNETAVHGLADLRPLEPGDLVSVDVAARAGRWCADAAWTWAVPPADERALGLLSAAWRACAAGVLAGARQRSLADIARAVAESCAASGTAVLRQFGGHGLGRHLHEEPVHAYLPAGGSAAAMAEGLVLNIEPVVCERPCEAALADDGWSWRCPPGFRCAQFELSLALGPERDFEVLNFAETAWLGRPLPPFY